MQRKYKNSKACWYGGAASKLYLFPFIRFLYQPNDKIHSFIKVRPKNEYNKIVNIAPYHIWVESDDKSVGKMEQQNVTLSKKLLVGKVERIMWPMNRCSTIERIRPPVGRTWWP